MCFPNSVPGELLIQATIGVRYNPEQCDYHERASLLMNFLGSKQYLPDFE